MLALRIVLMLGGYVLAYVLFGLDHRWARYERVHRLAKRSAVPLLVVLGLISLALTVSEYREDQEEKSTLRTIAEDLGRAVTSAETAKGDAEADAAADRLSFRLIDAKLDRFAEAALRQYPRLSRDEALAQFAGDLTTRVARVEESVGDLAKYWAVAVLSSIGNRDLGGGASVPTRYSNWPGEFVSRNDRGGLRWTCSDDAVSRYIEAAETFPEFPFPSAVAGGCLSTKDDPRWRPLVAHALDILERTVRVPGHDVDHEIWLNTLRRLVRDSAVKSEPETHR